MKQKILLTIAILIIASLGNGCKSNVVTETSDPKETFLNAINKLKEAKFFHATYKWEVDDATGKKILEAEEIDYVAPDKLRKITTKDISSSDSIEIGEDVYFLVSKDNKIDPNGSYLKTKATGAKNEYSRFPDGIFLLSEYIKEGKIEKVTFSGKMDFEGSELFSYSDVFGRSILVSPKTGLPIFIIHKQDSKNKTVTRFDYDTKPKIEAPTNLK